MARGALVLMADDFTRRALEGLGGILQGDIEEAFTKVRGDVDSKQSASFTPAGAVGTVWATSAPATIEEAINRLAHHISSGAGAVPIVELP